MPAVHANERAVLRGVEKVQPGQLPAGRVPRPAPVRVPAVQRGLQELHRHPVRHAADEDGHIHAGPAQPVLAVGRVSHAQAPETDVFDHAQVRRGLPRADTAEDAAARSVADRQ